MKDQEGQIKRLHQCKYFNSISFTKINICLVKARIYYNPRSMDQIKLRCGQLVKQMEMKPLHISCAELPEQQKFR